MQRRASILYPTMKDKKVIENYKETDMIKRYENNQTDAFKQNIQEKSKEVAETLNDNIKQIESSNNQIPSDWIMPVEGGYISSPYGNRKSPGPGASTFHSGIDIAVPVGTPVKAIADGEIKIATGGIKGYGNAVYINHGDINGKRVESEYGHVSQFCVKPGQKVKKGQVIALSGGAKGAPGSGVSQGPHLHLTIREYDNLNAKGRHVEPHKYLKKK